VTRELPRRRRRPGERLRQGARCQERRYQLAGIDPQAIASSAADLVVVDMPEQRFRHARRVGADAAQPDGSRPWSSPYMSIGQAET